MRHHSQSTGVGGNRELCVAELAHHSGGVLCAQRLVLALAGWRRLARLGWGAVGAGPDGPGDAPVSALLPVTGRAFLLPGGLGWPPLVHPFLSGQRMNASFNRWHLVNAYGAFGSMTQVRRE